MARISPAVSPETVQPISRLFVPSAGAVVKVTRPLAVSADQPVTSEPSAAERT